MKRKLILMTVIGAMMASLAGCSSETPASQTPEGDTPPVTQVTDEDDENNNQNTYGGVIKVAGSTSVAPLMKELKKEFEAKTGIELEIQESGSSAGITATIEQVAQIGMSSRDLKQEELDQGLVDTVIALDGIAVIVHGDNPVSNLTSEQITAIYKGEIASWAEVGGSDNEIIVISREAGSGTRGAFEELMDLLNGDESLVSSEALFENSTGAVKTNVATSQYAIGYISLGSLDDTVKALDVNSVTVSEENILNGSYVIARPFILCTMGEPSGNAKELIDFILSDEGQDIVSTENYIKVN